MNPVYQTIGRMINNGYELSTIYDVGACRGDWSKQIKKDLFPDATYFLFEANPVYNEILSSTGFYFFNIVLSDPDRESVDFYAGSDTGDSYYKETTKWYDEKPSVKVRTYTIDFLVKEHNLPKPSFIKLDTQGSELDILKGCETIIDEVDMIYVECPIIEYNAGAPNIQDYLDYFKRKDFVPVTIGDVHVGEDTILQIDFLFVKKNVKNKYLIPYENIRA